MNRKQFIESHGATCSNWTWSWSFVNQAERVVIFGAWDLCDDGSKALILSEDWEISRKGRRQSGYAQAREHIRLVEEEGYELKTFPMQYSADNEEDGTGPAKIEGFTPKLTAKTLLRIGSCWYASDNAVSGRLAEELDAADALIEGASKPYQ
jgi:5-methylcytosine-specific restriction protein A